MTFGNTALSVANLRTQEELVLAEVPEGGHSWPPSADPDVDHEIISTPMYHPKGVDQPIYGIAYLGPLAQVTELASAAVIEFAEFVSDLFPGPTRIATIAEAIDVAVEVAKTAGSLATYDGGEPFPADIIVGAMKLKIENRDMLEELRRSVRKIYTSEVSTRIVPGGWAPLITDDWRRAFKSLSRMFDLPVVSVCLLTEDCTKAATFQSGWDDSWIAARSGIYKQKYGRSHFWVEDCTKAQTGWNDEPANPEDDWDPLEDDGTAGGRIPSDRRLKRDFLPVDWKR